MTSQQKIPLTNEQERLWVEWKIDPNSHSYNTNIQFCFEGPLDIGRLEIALMRVVDKYAAFRTYFQEEHGIPRQVIRDNASIPLEYVDIHQRGLSSTTAKELGESIISARLKAPFNLIEFPLARFCLVKVTESLSYFIYVMPHILLDGHSAKLFSRALSAAYNNIDIGDGGQIFELKSYLDSIKNSQTKEWKTQANSYWMSKLEENDPYIDFKNGKDVASKDKRGHRAHFALSASTHKALKELAKKERTTGFILLASIFGIFLRRYFDQNNFAISYPVDVRGPEHRGFYGFGVNSLPMIFAIDDKQSFVEFLKRVTQQRRSDRPYETYSLKNIVQGLRANGRSIDKLLNVTFAEANFSLNSLDLNGVEVSPRSCAYEEVNNELALFYDGSSETLELAWDYRSALFDKDTIEYMTTSFLTLVDSILTTPNAAIDALQLFNAEQTATLLKYGQGECIPFSPLTVPEMVEEMMRKYPDNTAIIHGDEKLSYAELSSRAKQTAYQLHAMGVRPEDKVLLLLPKSSDLVVSILAVMQLGAAYLPLDTNYPEERLKVAAEEGQTKVIITQKDMRDRAQALSCPIYLIDQMKNGESLNEVTATPSQTAYVIYTSGSTGKPKAVSVSHHNLASRIHWFRETYALAAGDHILQNIQPFFDPSVYEILWPLTVGAALVMPSTEEGAHPYALAKLIDRYQIKIASFVPALLQLFLEAVNGNCQSLRYVISGGDALPLQLVRTFYQKLPAKLHNQYGPTETTIVATYHECTALDHKVPIGKPIYNTNIYIMDSAMKLMAPGITGEIYIGGAGISQGYLNDRELTREKFPEDPFEPNARLYRTHDKARWSKDGTIEFLGRIDHQVKIKGYRIELGDVESALYRACNFDDCVVTTVGECAGKRLAAYYVARDAIDSAYIKYALAEILPAYMIPSYFTKMEAIPKTANGKSDRTLLPNPISPEITASAQPLNITESQMRELWAEALEREAADIPTNRGFFDIGGDSLMVLKLCMLVEEAFDITVPDNIAFSLPTITDWANFIAGKKTLSAKEDGQKLAKRMAHRNSRALLREVKYG